MANLPFPCSALPLTANDFSAVLTALGADAASVWAILNVESGKAGYLPDRRPQILFEYGTFHTQTNGRFDKSNPNVSAPGFGTYPGGAAEYRLLAQAYGLDPEAALRSTSWGIAQVMGFNYQAAGYDTVEDFVQDSCASEGAQIRAFQGFLLANGIADALADQNWQVVARKYNGLGQVAKYSQSLQTSYAALQDPSRLPDLNVRAAQLYLTFLMSAFHTPDYNPHGIDGILGTPGNSHTLAALNAFQTTQGLPNTVIVDDGVLASLVAALPAAQDLSIA